MYKVTGLADKCVAQNSLASLNNMFLMSVNVTLAIFSKIFNTYFYHSLCAPHLLNYRYKNEIAFCAVIIS